MMKPTTKIPISPPHTHSISSTHSTHTMAPRFSLFLAILAVSSAQFAHAAHHSAAAPTPAVDCSSLILNMADCLSFVSAGSSVATPEGTCCSGLKTVLKTGAECLCEAFKSSASLGVTLNVTKALTLPQACKVNAPAATKCGLSESPAGAPDMSPFASAPAGAPTMSIGNDQAPAPAPGTSDSPLVHVPMASLVLSLMIALIFAF